MRQFQEETCHGKCFDFSLEEVIIGGVGDQGGLTVIFDAHLKLTDNRSFSILIVA